MKRLRFFLATMMAILATASGWAQESVLFYNLWIAGTQVTSENSAHLENIESVTAGTVTYSHSNKTLTLTNATIDLTTAPTNYPSPITSDIEGLKIVLVGENVIKNSVAGSSNPVIQSTPALTIKGNDASGKLHVEKAANLGSLIYVGSGDYVSSGDLTLSGCEVTLKSDRANDWIWGVRVDNGNLTLDGATLNIQDVYIPVQANAVQLLNGTRLDSSAEWNSAQKCYYAGGNQLHYDLSFIDTVYDVKIGGVQLTADNYTDISMNGGFNVVMQGGTVTFDPATYTLTLTNVRFDEAMADVGLELDAPVTVVLEGDNEIPNQTGIIVNQHCTIKGDGSLKVGSMFDGTAIMINGGYTLTIRDCTVKAFAQASDSQQGYGTPEENAYAITGASNASISVVNATLRAEIAHQGENGFGWWHSPIQGIYRVNTSSGSQFISPEGAYYDQEVKAVCVGEGTDRTIVYDAVEIDILPEPYAVLDDEGTMTFYYDKQKRKRLAGTVYDVNPAATDKQAWDNNTSITAVDFDESFADYDGMTSLHGLFNGLSNLKEVRHLDHLVTTNVTDMESMFSCCYSLTELDLSSLDTRQVTNMSKMFWICSSLKTIIVGDLWTTQGVTESTSTSMFEGCISLVGSHGTAYGSLGFDARAAHIDQGEASPGYLSGVKQAYAVFNNPNCTFYYDDLKSFRQGQQGNTVYDAKGKGWYTLNDSPAANITELVIDDSFADCHELTDLSHFFDGFRSIESIEGLQNLNTENVKYMSNMFNYCINLKELDLRHFDTSNVTYMDFMFNYCQSLSKIRCNDDWNRDGVSGSEMFGLCTQLKNYNADQKGIEMANPTTGYFTADEPYAVLSGNEQKLTFYYDDQKGRRQGARIYDLPWNDQPDWHDNATITTVDFDESFADYDGLESTNRMFYGLTKLTNVMHLDRLNTENVIGMAGMFQLCPSLVVADLTSLNTDKVISTVGMFDACGALKTIYCTADFLQQEGLSSDNMFLGCTSLVGGNGTTYDGSHIDAAYAHPDADGNPGYFTLAKPYAVLSGQTLTFRYDSRMEATQMENLTNDIYYGYDDTWGWRDANDESWRDGTNPKAEYITKVVFDDSFAGYHGLKSTEVMFYDMRNLTSIEGMQNLNTENVTNMNSMFSNCYNLENIDLSHFNTEKVETMPQMFADCKKLVTLNVSGFNTANVTNMEAMFAGCYALTTILADTDWALVAQNNGKQLQSEHMFLSCYSLVGGAGTAWGEGNMDAAYAHPDADGNPGYFTGTVTLKGDVNNDDVLSMADVLQLKDLVLGVTTPTDVQEVLGDMNYDGELTIADVTLLLQQVVKENLQRDLKVWLTSIKADHEQLGLVLQEMFSLQGEPTSEACAEAYGMWNQLTQRISQVETDINNVSNKQQKDEALTTLFGIQEDVRALQANMHLIQYNPDADKMYLQERTQVCRDKVSELQVMIEGIKDQSPNTSNIAVLESENSLAEISTQLQGMFTRIDDITSRQEAEALQFELGDYADRLNGIEERLSPLLN